MNTCHYLLHFSWWQQGNFRVPSRSTTMKSATAGKAFGFWNNKDNTFQFKLPPGTCKAEISFMGVTGIHEFYFSKKSQVKLVMCPGRTMTMSINQRPIPRVENMAEFYNPTRPSHFRNGSLIRKRRVYSPHEL